MFATGVSTIILASVILFAIIAIMARTTNKWRIKRTGKRLPGPPRWPLIGNTFFLTRKMEDLLDVFTWLFDSYPAICQMWIGPKMLVAINDPDFSKIVLADYKLLHRSYVDILFKGLSGTGLIAAEHLIGLFTSFFDSYPSIYQIRVGPAVMVFINDPDLAKTVLANHKLVHRAYVQMLFTESLGKGLVTAEPATWRFHRKIIAPAFNSTFVRHYIDVFNTQSRIMVEQMKVHQDGPEFNMEHCISPCMMDIIVETTMNVKLGTQMNQDQVFKRAMESVNEISTMRFFKPWLHPEFFFNLSTLGVRHAKSVKAGRGFVKRVIEKQMEEITNLRLRPNVADHGKHADTATIQKRNLLNLLMEWDNGGVKIHNEQIIDELITEVAAAVETTTTTMNMLMFALACYPDVQEKVYEEMTEICGNGEDDEQTITVDQLTNLVYLERAIKETLRLFPILSFIPRDVMEDITIGDYHVPKGAMINVALFSIHRNEKIWPDPLKFDPDRFLPEEVDKRHPYSYMPFGAGPRNCIGSKFAMLAMKIMCVKIVQKYALSKDHPKNIADTKMKFGVTMKPCDPVTIRIRKRRGNIAKA